MRPMNEVRTNLMGVLFLAKGGLYTVFIVSLFLSFAAQLHAEEPYELKFPLGLKKELAVIPDDNPMTKEKVELGKLLFFDRRLSMNDIIACASCHIPSLAFTDGQPVSTGINSQQGGRSAPTAINRVFSSAQFWDGRAATLEEQSIGPLINPIEHGFVNHDELVVKLNDIEGYKKLFQNAFSSGISAKTIGQAMASFQRTILSGNSPFDQYNSGEDSEALSSSAKNGLELFRGKALCFTCHSGANFSDEKFHNLGVDWDTDHVDLGRYVVTKDAKDMGAFKTPTLREITRTAPYMHDGRFATLRQVVDFYDQGGIANPHRDPLVQPLKLTETEKNDLVTFLESLNGEGWQMIPPIEFPR
ncbi:MAG: cytochrome-c peroxidase [Nitrospirales bacterium]|nr:MAG: cytochrome-c peroxidase [Nitrospirales bacterium]